MVDIDKLVSEDGAYVGREVFSDADIYKLEMKQVFGRSWLFLAHETQLPNPQDYLTTFMGEDPVIVIHQEDGTLKAFLNACRHRGPLLCASEEGNASSFTCPYHGWVYGASGDLLDAPQEGNSGWHNELNKEQHGLRPIRIESYKGLYFGNFDEQAPSLEDYLGDYKWYADTVFSPLPSGVEFLGGPMRQRLQCNWKIASENIFADTYHVFPAHGPAVRVCLEGKEGGIGIEEDDSKEGDALGIAVTVNGHSMGMQFDGMGAYVLNKNMGEWAAYLGSQRENYIKQLGPRRGMMPGSSINGGIFPNFMFVPGFTFRVIHPLGPNECEIWMWTVVEKDVPAELKRDQVKANARMLGTSGLFETDDCANMERINNTVSSYQGSKLISNYSMGLGREQHRDDLPGLTDQRLSDTGFRGYYRRWALFMKADKSSDIPLDKPRRIEGAE
ncbi:MAG: naphthalene 1,2-dioxygenase [Piscirickettsiaceae bacterium]|nr:MAG: naphthalene 1,2-dioxygenase [Piscirickettsiaceae bacterium]